jgi:hypothetical protein
MDKKSFQIAERVSKSKHITFTLESINEDEIPNPELRILVRTVKHSSEVLKKYCDHLVLLKEKEDEYTK